MTIQRDHACPPRPTPKEAFRLLKADEPLLDRVPTKLLAPLKLFHGGNGYVWIADQLQIPVGTVRSRIHRARAHVLRLRQERDAPPKQTGAQPVDNVA